MKNLHFQRFIFFEGFLFITFSVFQFIIIDTVGLNYDEALFINAALPSNLFSQESNYIQTRIFGLPFSVFDYIGALKSYLFIPIFYLFPINVFTIRFPMIIVTIIGVAVISRSLIKSNYKFIAVFFTLLSLLDPVYSIYSLFDYGPVALSGLIKCLILYVTFKFYDNPNRVQIIAIGFLILLGIFNKLDFIYSILPFLIIFLILNYINVFKIILNSKILFSFATFMFLAICSVLYFKMIKKSFWVFDLQTVDEGSGLNLDLFVKTFISSNFLQHFAYQNFQMINLMMLSSLCLSAISLTLIIKGGIFHENRFNSFILILFPFSVFCLLISPGIWGIHHVVQIWPIPQLAFVISAKFLFNFSRHMIWRSFIIFISLIIIFNQILINHHGRSLLFYKDFHQPTWSQEIYDVVGHITSDSYTFKSSKNPIIVASDWGFSNQIGGLIYRTGSFSVADFGHYFKDFPNVQGLANGFPIDHPIYIVTHRKKSEYFPGTYETTINLVTYLKRNNSCKDEIIYQGVHAIVFRLDCL